MLAPFSYHEPLDILLRGAPPETADLRLRLDWLGRLVNWVRKTGPKNPDGIVVGPERIQTTRLKYILQILDRDPAVRLMVTETLVSILRDTRALELFMHVGVPNQQGFIGEFIERVNHLVLPQAPRDEDLISVFSTTFRFESDADWIRYMDPAVFKGWVDLFTNAKESRRAGLVHLSNDVEDALFLITDNVRSIGLSRLIRNRVKENDFRKLPFFELNLNAERFLRAQGDARGVARDAFLLNLRQCFETVAEVQSYFRNHGASLELIYQVNRLKSLIHRIETLVSVLSTQEQGPVSLQNFLSLLIRENLRARKISKLLKENLVLICQKIIETNSETGEHYITRDRREHWEILKKSFGGGIMTGLTTLVKCLLYHVVAPPFILGLCAFTNYGVSFVGMQALGFTLATKQPAMTASSLASTLEETSESVAPLVEEVIHLVRSQITAVIGNIAGVVPMVILIDFIFSYFHGHLLDIEHSRHTIDSFSILGPTPIYAAGTGVLLWLSSIFSGWFANWFSFQRLPEAIEHHHRMKTVFGKKEAQKLSIFFKNNVGGLASNLSLALLLAMTPPLASFFGFPFDVRHVTLSSGAITASAMSIGPAVFSSSNFWLGVVGIASMGVLNLTVAFALALIVAIWAKRVSSPKRGVIYRQLLKEFLNRPWIFFFAPASEK